MKKDHSQLFADDIVVGQVFSGIPREVGDSEFTAFAGITGDSHPIHYDDAYAAKTHFGRRLAHGLLVMSMTALGAMPISRRLEESMVAFIDQGARFLKPVFVGDTLTNRLEVAEIQLSRSQSSAKVRFSVLLENQDGDAVLEGHHTYLLSCKSQVTNRGT